MDSITDTRERGQKLHMAAASSDKPKGDTKKFFLLRTPEWNKGNFKRTLLSQLLRVKSLPPTTCPENPEYLWKDALKLGLQNIFRQRGTPVSHSSLRRGPDLSNGLE